MRGTAFWRADGFLGLLVSCAMFAIIARGPVFADGQSWAWAAPAVVAVYLVILLPRLAGAGSLAATVLLCGALVAAYVFWPLGGAIPFALMASLCSLLAGHLLLALKRLLLGAMPVDPSRVRAVQPLASPSAKPPVPLPPAEPMPARIGRYDIEKRLGKGAMGEVFLGREAGDGTLVAIKTLALAQEFSPDELADVRARFFREAETAGRLHHPQIVAIKDSGEDDGLAFIAMEYLAGSDLRPFTRAGHLLPLPVVVSVVARIADALDCAHRHNVVHRDVKPANVMYDPPSDQVKVMDFGIARITDSSRTRTGMVLGTPSYMSPEQLSGKKVDGRADLYALGVMLYQMACGQLPFVGQSMGQLMFRIANEACPDVRVLNPQVPEALAAIIERAMRKEAAQRYATGDEMARALRACLATGSERPGEAGNGQ